jgi:uncharacterized protein (DUF983 family)
VTRRPTSSESEDRATQDGWVVFRRALPRVLRRRCPQCGEGGLFAGRFRLSPRCARCGLVYQREAGSMTGSMYLSAAVTELFAAGLIAIVWLATDWGPALSIGVSVPIVLLFTYSFLPISRGLWVAVEYSTDAANGEAWVEPR